MLAVLDLSQSGARTTEDIFTGVSQSMPLGRVYGGQVLAQSIVAAERTIPDGRIGALDARLLPAPRRCVQGHHVLGRPHPRRTLVLDAAHAGVPGGRADLLDDRVVPGRGPRPRASGRRCPTACPSPRTCPTSRITSRACTRSSKRLLHRPPGRHAARPVADLPVRATASASRARPSGCARDARSPTTRHCTARRSPTSAT